MDGAKRLEQAFEKLENYLKGSEAVMALGGKEGDKLKTLMHENKALKEKHKEASKKLDKIITKIEKGSK
ncbi:MAG: hypothetical protein VX154_02680 [Pseudomonadota bacterium]|nr:hypothetical protein [Pseudomonadota bacterium]